MNLNVSSSSEEELRFYIEQFEATEIDANMGDGNFRTFSKNRTSGKHAHKPMSVYPQNSGISIQINNQVDNELCSCV